MNKIYLGASGLFKREKALAEARLLLSTDSLDTHPDFFLLEPAEGKISVADAERIVEFLSYSPLRVARKVVIIDKCHLGTTEFQQSLLKLLEDGGEKAQFLLTTESMLLDTIHSRCTTVSVKKWSDATMEQWIEESGISMNPVAFALADGRPGLYREILTDEALLTTASNLKERLCKCPKAIVELGVFADGFEMTKEHNVLLIGFIVRTLFDELVETGEMRLLDAIDLCNAEQERMKMRSYGKTEIFRFYRKLHSILSNF